MKLCWLESYLNPAIGGTVLERSCKLPPNEAFFFFYGGGFCFLFFEPRKGITSLSLLNFIYNKET